MTSPGAQAEPGRPGSFVGRERELAELRAMLAEIYNRFTAGFDTADLKDAKALSEKFCPECGSLLPNVARSAALPRSRNDLILELQTRRQA